MAATESLSSWAPQAKAHPPPPMAHAPNPTGVMCRSELPSRRVCMTASQLAVGLATGDAYMALYAAHRINQRGRAHAPTSGTGPAAESRRGRRVGRGHAGGAPRGHLHRPGDD